MKDLPDNLPPLPPVPDGFLRWEYRGIFWDSPDHCVHAVYYGDGEPWSVFSRCAHSGLLGESHYLEAVREPAKPANYAGQCVLCGETYEGTKEECKGRKCSECIAREKRLGYVTEIAGIDEPAKDQPASGEDDEARKAWFIASANLEDGAEITAGSPKMLRAMGELPPTGVEARVCKSPTPSRYRWTHEGVTFDFYRLCEILGITSHAQAHALKKVIRAGRGGKTILQDIDEAIDAMRRFREMVEEDAPAESERRGRVCGGWRPIKTAPRDGTEINGYRDDQGVFTFRWSTMEELIDRDRNGDPVDEYDQDLEGWWHDRWGWMEGELAPTHWQPLPQPPEGGTEKQ